MVPLKLDKATVSILPKTPAHLPVPEKFAVTKRIHALIVEKAQKEKLENYQVAIPKADNAPLKLVAIPGGSFKMGPEEGKKREVEISPFWM